MAGEYVNMPTMPVAFHPAENCVDSECAAHSTEPNDGLVRGEWLVCKGAGGTQVCLVAADAHCRWCGRKMVWRSS